MNKREREGEHSSRRRVSQRHQRNKKFLNKGIAYFLIFLMLLGNLQALTYAEGNAKEIVEQIGMKAEEKFSSSVEKEDSAKEGKTEENIEEAEKEESSEEEKSKTSDDSGESEEKKESEEAKESEEVKESEEAKEAEESKEEEKSEYMEAGSLEALSGGNLLYTASFEDGTFFEGTFMKLVPIEEEAVLEEAKAHLEKEYRSKDSEEQPELTVLEAVDISFYRLIDGEEREVQPKKGKKVEIRLQKTQEMKEALEEKKDLQLVHLDEGQKAETLTLKDEGEDLSFSAKSFSPYVILAASGATTTPEGHELRAFWREEPTAANGHSYTDEIVEDSSLSDSKAQAEYRMRQQKNLRIIPPEQGSNALNTTTLGIELTLKGGVDTVYAPGEVTIDVPARIFKGWDKDDLDKVAVSTTINKGGAYPVMPAAKHGIPKKGEEGNSQISFSYEIIKKGEEKFLRLSNFEELKGSVSFNVDIAYNLTPSMLEVTHKSEDGEEKGVYDYAFPVTMEVKNNKDSSLNATAEQEMSVHVETKVNPTKVTLKPGTADVNGGVYFNWDPSWGDKPTTDEGQYFYAVWYVQVDRATGSSQPFTYKFERVLREEDGGDLVGAKKIPTNQYWNSYFRDDTLEAYARNGYPKIAQYMGRKEPAESEKYLENPIGRTYVGISKDPSVPKLPSQEPYLGWDNYHPNGRNNSQLYALVYKYPFDKFKDAQGNYKNSITINNKIKFTETWADKHVREVEVKGEPMTIFPRPNGGGGFSYNKYNTGIRQNAPDIFGLQSIYKDGQSAPLRYGNYLQSFTLTTDYKAANENVTLKEDGSYTTSSDPNKKGSGVTLIDGKYYLLSVRTKGGGSINGKSVNGNLSQDDLSGLDHTTGADTDAYREKYDLTDEDYHYSFIYMKDMRVHDVEKVKNAYVPFNQKPELRKKDESYPPVTVFLRKKGESSFFEYGKFSYNKNGQVIFTKKDASEGEIISDQKQLDLDAVFGKSIVGLKLEQDSPYYSTGFDLSYTLEITPTKAMQDEIKKTMSKEDYNISFLGAAAEAEGRQLDAVKNKGRIGEYWGQVGYTLSPLKISSNLNKSYDSATFKRDTENAVQSLNVRVMGYNQGALPASLQTEEITKQYQVNKGTIYDLLPAGTYVDEASIQLGTWSSGHAVSEELRFERGRDYTVRLDRNWEYSGRTMLIVDFTAPKNTETKKYREWNKGNNLSGWKMTYTLYNPFTNILDRGRSAINTVGYINQDPDTIWNGNYISDQTGEYPRVADILKYQKIREKEAKKNKKFTTSVVQEVMPFEAITETQGGFNNTISTVINPNYLGQNVSYMGDSYTQRLFYWANADSRTTDMLLFDILGEDDERNGDFVGVDISSMLTKPSYGNPDSADTLNPKVYYATEVPTDSQRDLTNGIWHEWNYVDESQNTVDRKKIKAIAFDLRKTKSGKDFTLNKAGILVAYVKMQATTEQAKKDLESSNTAYFHSVRYNTEKRPENAPLQILNTGSKHRLIKPLSIELTVRKEVEAEEGRRAPKDRFRFILKKDSVGVASGSELRENLAQPMPGDSNGEEAELIMQGEGTERFAPISFLFPGVYTYTLSEKDDGLRAYDYDHSVYKIVYTVSRDKQNPDNLRATEKIYKEEEELSEIVFKNHYKGNSGGGIGGGGGGGSTPRVPSMPGNPGTVEGADKKTGDTLGENRSIPEETVNHPGEVLSEARRSRMVRTDDSSKMLYYAAAFILSILGLAFYGIYGRKKK